MIRILFYDILYQNYCSSHIYDTLTKTKCFSLGNKKIIILDKYIFIENLQILA